MNDGDAIAHAGRRLAAALEALEQAAERRGELDRGRDALLTQIHAMSADRARLADDLDGAAARSNGLEAAHRAIAERIDAAIESIRWILDGAQDRHTGK